MTSDPKVSSQTPFRKRIRKSFLVTLGLLPFLWITTVDYSLRRDNFNLWKVEGCLVAALISLGVSTLWALHLIRGKPMMTCLLTLFVFAVGWKCLRTDWIVEVPYVYMGSPELRSYTPPVGPFWISPDRSGEEFEAGGWGGPTGIPELRVNVELMLTKVVFLILPAYLFLWTCLLVTRAWDRKSSDE
jgi:hypothetical protein